MGKKILKTLTNNFGFKLLALAFAVILWLVVYSVDDPVITRNYTTNVTLVNEGNIQDKYFEILDNSNNVTFSVSAQRSYLDRIDDSDFSASADFNDMVVSEDGTRGSIKIDIVASRYSSSLKINGSSKFVTVSLEDAKSKQFIVTPTTEGAVADGYALGDVTISGSNVLKVSGPTTVVSRISKAIAAINIDGMSQNLSDNVVPVLYDENGDEVDTTKLTLSRTTVTVSAMILATKKVSINLTAKGTPADGYALAGISSSASSVWIKGPTATINPITSIEIPSDVLDIGGASASLETMINITEYLPTGVALLDSSDATISIFVDIEAYETRVFEVSVDNITIEGLSAQNELSFPQGVVYVSLTGLAVDLDSLDAQNLRGNVDVTALDPGSHVVNVEVDVDESRFTVTSSRAQVNIDVKSGGTQAENGEAAEDEGGRETDANGANSSDENENGIENSSDTGDSADAGDSEDTGTVSDSEVTSNAEEEDGTASEPVWAEDSGAAESNDR
jgi:YbbR domain-containing protein